MRHNTAKLARPFLIVSVIFATASTACKRTATPPKPVEKGALAMTIIVETPAFKSNQTIPKRHTGDAEDLSPALALQSVPETAKELAIIVDDPDAPTPTPWVHWIIYKIAPDKPSLPEGIPKGPTPATPANAMQGKNSWGTVGYRGPAPPKGHGVHHYYFKVYALDAELDVQPGLDKDALLAAMAGHVIAQGELIGTYER